MTQAPIFLNLFLTKNTLNTLRLKFALEKKRKVISIRSKDEISMTLYTFHVNLLHMCLKENFGRKEEEALWSPLEILFACVSNFIPK